MADPGRLKSYWETYVLNRFAGEKPDAYVVSYPKCGRTWLRVILRKYAALAGRSGTVRDRMCVELADDLTVRFDHDQSTWAPAPVPVAELTIDRGKYRGSKVVFLVRDPRDVLVSSWYHLSYREPIYDDDLSAFIRDDHLGIHKVVAFMNLWVEEAAPEIPVRVVRYEDLHGRAIEEVRGILGFLDVPVDAEAIARAVEESSFEKMKRMEEKAESGDPWLEPGARGGEKSMKVRRGEVGGYRQELSEDDIAYLDEVIRRELAPELGYG